MYLTLVLKQRITIAEDSLGSNSLEGFMLYYALLTAAASVAFWLAAYWAGKNLCRLKSPSKFATKFAALASICFFLLTLST